MTEQESAVNHRQRRRRRRSPSTGAPPPRWPGDPEHVEAGKIDFEAIAHVLANTCRWGGRARRFFSLGQYALVMSEEAEALEGIAGEGRRALAHGEKVDRAVREAAGLDPKLSEEWSEALRFVALMTESGERCALGVGGAGFIFPPLHRTVRPLAPEAAARRWLARFRELAGSSPADTGNVRARSGTTGTAPASVPAEASS